MIVYDALDAIIIARSTVGEQIVTLPREQTVGRIGMLRHRPSSFSSDIYCMSADSG